MKTTSVPQHEWYDDQPLTLTFPDEWDVKRCKMACEGQASISEAQIVTALNNPLGMPPLKELANKANEVVIIFDDMTRPTKTWQYSNPILNVLHSQGVPKDNIRFVIAPGSHGTYNRLDFVKKLGDSIVDDYQVYNHNPYEMTDYLGDTNYGCPVHVNSEVMNCDLKLGIGTVLFHRLTGLSGGGKIISPGVAGIETIRYNHGDIGGFGPGLTPHPTTGYLKNDENVMRLDAEEAARMSGLDFKVDTVLNLERNPLEIYAGDFVKTQRAAAEGTKKWHRCESPEADIVVLGNYMRENEPQLSFFSGYNMVKENGTIVLLYTCPDGDINHWIFGRHGKTTGASLWTTQTRPLRKGARLIITGPNKLKSFEMRYPEDQVQWIREWDDVVDELLKHHGPGSKVAVVPDGTSAIPEAYMK